MLAGRNCWRATDPLGNFEELPKSTHAHRRSQIAVTAGLFYCIQRNYHPYFSDYLLAVGGELVLPGSGHAKTELLSRENSWSSESDYLLGT